MSLTTNYSKGNNVGNYTITDASGFTHDNYEFEYVIADDGQINVTPREITIEWTQTSFEYDGDGAFVYRPGTYHNTQYPQRLLAEDYPRQNVAQEYPSNAVYAVPPCQRYGAPSQPQYTQNDSVMARLEAMEREMANLRAENQELKTRYGNLK